MVFFAEYDPDVDDEESFPGELVCLHCLIEEGDEQLARGLDLARVHGQVVFRPGHRRVVRSTAWTGRVVSALLQWPLLGVVQVVDERVAQRQDCLRESAHPSFGAFAPDVDHAEEFGLLFVGSA